MFAYIENGKIYKHTFSGFMEVFKNEKGFYLMSNRGLILPAKSSSFSVGVGGVYNGIAIGLVSAIDRSIRQNKMKRDEIMEIYIDPLTGEYDFSDE